MDSRSLSAGSIRLSRQIFFILVILSSLLACRADKQEKDSQISELQKDVRKLSEENRQLLREVQSLREEVKNPQTEPAIVQPQPQPGEEMTLQRMKTDVEPLLKEVIEKIKKTAETPRKDKQYGMRVEYDVNNAVYGLLNQEGGLPAAKVIVKYEKFLESAEDSRSYGSGNSTFLFMYKNDRWVLQSYE